MGKRFLETLKGNKTDRPPFWFMRQAGRYLPEYLKTRADAGSFLELVYNPDLAVEVTLQPIRRYHPDAAILFSDILVIPHALGQKTWFEVGHGPRLEKLEGEKDLSRLNIDKIHKTLGPIYETVSGLASSLPSDVALIGFAGSPWTVATYMAQGSGSPDQRAAKIWAYTDPVGFSKLMDILVEATSQYLIKQVDAGAEALQLFDTWAGSLMDNGFEVWSIEPTTRIINQVRETHPDIPFLGFPRGAGEKYPLYAVSTGVDAVSIDTGMSPKWAAENIQPHVAVQGNLDPLMVVSGGQPMLDRTGEILVALNEGPHIFNLGHGFVPETPPENVAALSQYLHDWKSE